jgi:hypothetical protein
MTIPTLNFDTILDRMTPPKLRQTRFIAWLTVLFAPLKLKYDDIFNKYKTGDTSTAWSNVTAYVVGDRVRYGIGIYEALTANTGIVPISDSQTWYKVNDDFVGTDERIMYNSQRIVFEYLLNRYFNVTPTTAPLIYITTNNIDTNGFYLGDSAINENGELAFGTYGFSNANDYLGTSYSLNQYAFTINVPIALYTPLGATNTDRDNVIRNIADKYVIAGVLYDITTY